jgi:nicotinamidase-related amidase
MQNALIILTETTQTNLIMNGDNMKILVVVDMQNDFIDGALGTKEAVAIVPAVKEKIENFDGRVIFTRDTHEADYLSTQEGKNLPVEHCIKGTDGWQIRAELDALRKEEPVDKPTFGSVALGQLLKAYDTYEEKIESITFIGLCTDICVISNAMTAKAYLPETPIYVDASCCAGVTPESHERALDAMAVCQINILNR